MLSSDRTLANSFEKPREVAEWPVVCEGRRVKMCVIVLVDQCPVGSKRGAGGHGTAAFSYPGGKEGRQGNNIFPDGLGNN